MNSPGKMTGEILMLPEDDEGPSDPRRYRRTLSPLEIEDAERPPTLGRRLKNLFRKKNRTAVPLENEDPSLPKSRERNDDSLPSVLPEDEDPENPG